MRKSIYVLLLIAVLILAGSTIQAKTNEEITIGISMDSLESGFWVANFDAMVEKADELGVNIVDVMAEGDPNMQNQQIENLIARGVDAIVIAPRDGSAIAVSVNRAQAAGIPVIMNNRPAHSSVEPDLTILSDNYVMAKRVLQWFVDKARDENKTYKAVLLVGNLGDENAIERRKGHREVLEDSTDVIELVATIPTEWDHQVALEGMQNAFNANPDIDLIITPSDFLFPPMRSVLTQNNRWVKRGEDGHVAIISFDGDEEGMEMLREGYSWADAAQAAIETGELSIEWGIKLANGEKPADKVILDPGVIVTIDNLDEVGPSVWGW